MALIECVTLTATVGSTAFPIGPLPCQHLTFFILKSRGSPQIIGNTLYIKDTFSGVKE